MSLAEDLEGNIWVGTAGGGLDRVNARRIQLEGLDSGASLAAIQSVCEDIHGVQWGATQGGLLVSRANGRWSPALTNAPWTNAVDCVAADKDGTLWIGTRNTGLYCWRDGQFASWDAGGGFAGRAVLDLLPASTGDLWIATQSPIALRCLHAGQLRAIKVPKTAGRITALAEDAAGGIWAGSVMGALMRVAGNRLVEIPNSHPPALSRAAAFFVFARRRTARCGLATKARAGPPQGWTFAANRKRTGPV